jgi:hypothetical protein
MQPEMNTSAVYSGLEVMLHTRTSETPGLKSSKIMFQKFSDYIFVLFSFALCVILFVGWRLCRFELITPAYGIGHLLGILGTLLMLMLLIYPARKRFSALSTIGSVKMWFRIHMIFGILGPVCILFHTTFRLGSLNSNVALVSMLVITMSGIIGRFIYCNIHFGLYGRKASLIELRDNLQQQKEQVKKQLASISGIKEELFKLADYVLKPRTSLFESIKLVLSIGWRTTFVLWKIRFITNIYLRRNSASKGWAYTIKRIMRRKVRIEAQLFLLQAVSVARFGFFERLFALWQVLHIPLTYILVVVAILHVIVVSLY